MIEVTVRTLDSLNHPFEVDDDITVAQFKEKIAPTVNIPAETQRIIYCGRVLNDNAKLSEFDVHGKVVHLVERPPPSQNEAQNNASASNRTPSPLPQQQRVLGGNAMYLGSMAIPLETPLVPPPPSHSLAASRLNVARRMLRRAEGVINLLENPSARPTEVPATETQDDETPVFEARVIVPTASSEPFQDVLSSLSSNGAAAAAATAAATTAAGSSQTAAPPPDAGPSSDGAHGSSAQESQETPPAGSATSTPDAPSPVSTSTEDLTGEQARAGGTGAATGGNTLAENASRTTEMADLLDQLARLQTRFAPFLQRYQTFMREDPTVAEAEVRRTQVMMNRVSEVLHILGHAYHSLSDIIIQVRTRPARPLLCRPILIQHSAVLQTGFPIQVEAQINFSPENVSPNNNTGNASTPNDRPAQDGATPATGTATGASANSSEGPRRPASRASTNQPHLFSFASAATGQPNGVQMTSFPSLTGLQVLNGRTRMATSRPRSGSVGSAPRQQRSQQQQAAGGGNSGNAGAGTNDLFGDSNLEFFMEVTPETITIDSLEASLLNQDGGIRTPPQELIQSIVQMATHFVRGASQGMATNQGQAAAPQANATSTASADANSSATSQQAQATSADASSSGAQQNGTTVPGQNSQARGNTQTNPTTSTRTRSTPRPHVHLAQHTMQGFDPFLPCNSHHMNPRRRQTRVHRTERNTENTNNNQGPNIRIQNGSNLPGPINNLIQGVLNSLTANDLYGSRRPASAPQTPSSTPSRQLPPLSSLISSSQPAAASRASGATANSSGATGTTANITLQDLMSNMPNMISMLPPVIGDVFRSLGAEGAAQQGADVGAGADAGAGAGASDSDRGPTILQLIQMAGEPPLEGEGVINDLILLLMGNFTIAEVLRFNVRNLQPLTRMRAEIRSFVQCRILDGASTPTNVERGVSRLLAEMQPFLENFSHLQVRDNIDIVRSLQMLLRTKLPYIINLAASRASNSLRLLVEQCKVTWMLFGAIVTTASANGQQGILEVVTRIVNRYMDSNAPGVQENALFEVTNPEEPMDVEVAASSTEADQASGSSVLGIINLADSGEEMPSVVLGSESWHSQVPQDWVPIITRDSQRQRRQNQQSPLSDAYLSGMPSKRRKIVTSKKPQGSLPQVITESIRRAVTTTGLSSVNNLEAVAQEAGADLTIQSAYRDLLRTRVQSSLENNTDFSPDRFPNASNYFNKSQ